MTIQGLNVIRWLVAVGLAALAVALGVAYDARPGEVWEVRAMVGVLALVAVLATPLEQWFALHAGEQRRKAS